MVERAQGHLQRRHRFFLAFSSAYLVSSAFFEFDTGFAIVWVLELHKRRRLSPQSTADTFRIPTRFRRCATSVVTLPFASNDYRFRSPLLDKTPLTISRQAQAGVPDSMSV